MKALKHASRLTIDIPAEWHKKLKAIALNKGVSMKDLVMSAMRENFEELCEHGYGHIPNAETIKSIKKAEKDRHEHHKFKTADEAFAFIDSLAK